MMKAKLFVTLGAVALMAGSAAAQEKLKVGVVVTLSGPSAVLGQQARDGFNLAVKQLGGKLGGIDTEVIVVDDELKPMSPLTRSRVLSSAIR
jgi:branched-chain amino acid transport system substrate-binding protein